MKPRAKNQNVSFPLRKKKIPFAGIFLFAGRQNAPADEIANNVCMANNYFVAVFLLVRIGAMNEPSESSLYSRSVLKVLLKENVQLVQVSQKNIYFREIKKKLEKKIQEKLNK
jgi:hypothetical protein